MYHWGVVYILQDRICWKSAWGQKVTERGGKKTHWRKSLEEKIGHMKRFCLSPGNAWPTNSCRLEGVVGNIFVFLACALSSLNTDYGQCWRRLDSAFSLSWSSRSHVCVTSSQGCLWKSLKRLKPVAFILTQSLFYVKPGWEMPAQLRAGEVSEVSWLLRRACESHTSGCLLQPRAAVSSRQLTVWDT